MITFARHPVAPDRWRQYPTPERECDGYTIARYEFKPQSTWGAQSCGPDDKVKPYYVLYHNSNRISEHGTRQAAVHAARMHHQGQQACV